MLVEGREAVVRMQEKTFIIGVTDKETQAINLIVIAQKEKEHSSASKIVISKVIDLRAMRKMIDTSGKEGYFTPVTYVVEKITITGYPIFAKLISEEQAKIHYPWFF